MNPHTVLDLMYHGQTMVFAHRGASAYAPMNTLPAFELAFELGAHGIELDVHLTRDGKLAVIHDFTVDSTSDGQGTVTEMTRDQLDALDAGSWFDASFAGARIPSLEQVFELVGEKMFINVEMKSFSPEPTGLEQVVADTIREFDLQERVIVSSFNPLSLIALRQIDAEIPIGYLYSADVPEFPPEVMQQLRYEAIHPHHELLNAQYIMQAKSNGHRINTWTVNDTDRAVELRNMGVDMMITDKPDVILDALVD